MSEMTPGTHARTTKRVSTQGLATAWAVLVGMGGTSATYNVYHAVHHGSLNIVLALLYGTAPVLAAALLSHIVAEYAGGKVMQAITFSVMLGAMVLSIGATASVVQPAAGPWMQWLFGAVTDAAALVALRVILDSRNRKNAAGTEMDAARSEAQAARAEAAEVARERSRLEAELATVKAELGAELTAARAEMATANGALEALRSAAHPVRPKRSKRVTPAARRSADTQDLTTELRAVQMLDAHPELRAKGQAAELARRLGISPAHGRRLHARLTSEERPSEPGNERAHERSPDTAHERSEDR